ncbi:hypothetical protein DFP72DRAFT_1130392, partial [Ephemerocybe angulata]
RYVLGKSTRYICLWDIGQTGKGSWDSRPNRLSFSSIVRVSTPMSQIWDMTAPAAATVASFRFATVENKNEYFRVFEVGPLPDVCSIREIASLPNQRISPELYLVGFWLQGDSLVFHFREGIVVWDFIHSTYTAIKTSGIVDAVATRGNLIIAIDYRNVGVWTIPPLKPIEPTSLELRELLSEGFPVSIDFGTMRKNDNLDWPDTIYLPFSFYSDAATALEYAAVIHGQNVLKIERFLVDITGSSTRQTPISSSHPVEFMSDDDEICGNAYRTICGNLCLDTIIWRKSYPGGIRTGIFHWVKNGSQLRDVDDVLK